MSGRPRKIDDASRFRETLSGQIVMEGFLDTRISPAARALPTRLIAIVPAAVVTAWSGSAGETRCSS